MSDKKSFTIDDVMSWGPCGSVDPDDGPYNRGYVTGLFAGRESLTVDDVLDLDIPDADKLWVVLREPLLTEADLHELACRLAEEVLPIFERAYPNDNRPRLAIEAKRKWLKGEITDDELAAAEAAARAASWTSEWATVWATAEDEAWAAAEVAARRAATRARQVDIIKNYLAEGE